MPKAKRIAELINGMSANMRRAPRAKIVAAFAALEHRGALVWDQRKGDFVPGKNALRSWSELSGQFENRVLYAVIGAELRAMADREKAARKGTMLSGRRVRLRTGRADP
jgi:hypothetical protein